MPTKEEYLRLPHGMIDRDGSWLRKEREILQFHDACGQRIGCEPIKYSPISFSSTFERAANTANEKIYKFDDRSGRSLTLSCDSTPSVFRNYILANDGEPKRVSFIAPLFRYRNSNSHNRHFTQIGYSIINEIDSDDDIDINLIELVKAIVDLCSNVGITVKIYMNDYYALRKTLSPFILEEKLPEFCRKLQFADMEERLQLLEKEISDKDVRNDLINLFSRKVERIIENDQKMNRLMLLGNYLRIYKMANELRNYTNVDVYFEPTNLHSFEIIDTYSIRIISSDDVPLAEGGKYTKYARNFNKMLTSFWSIATGIEPLERNIPNIISQNKYKKLAIYNLDSSASFILKVMRVLSESGYIISYLGKVTKMNKVIKQAKKKFTDIVVIGKREEDSSKVEIRSLNSKDYTIIKL